MEKLEGVIKRLFQHYMQDVNWNYGDLTKEEKSLVSSEEYAQLKEWVSPKKFRTEEEDWFAKVIYGLLQAAFNPTLDEPHRYRYNHLNPDVKQYISKVDYAMLLHWLSSGTKALDAARVAGALQAGQDIRDMPDRPKCLLCADTKEGLPGVACRYCNQGT